MIEGFAEKSTRWIGSPTSLVVHTLLFAAAFVAGFLGVSWDEVLLVLTTVVSLEAIYLAIFIQMSVNRTTQSLQEVEKDVDEIQKDVDEIQEDVDEIQKDVDEIQEDVEDIQEDEEEDDKEHNEQHQALEVIKSELNRLVQSIEKLDKLQQGESK